MSKAHCPICGGDRDPEDEIGRCPWCKAAAPPCREEDDVDIRINWGELRLLFMAAEGRAAERQNMHAFAAIVRLARGLEDHWPKKEPLTLKTARDRKPVEAKEIVIPTADELKANLMGELPGDN